MSEKVAESMEGQHRVSGARRDGAGMSGRNSGLRSLLLGFLLFFQSVAGCGSGYILRVGLEEGKILWRRRPISEVLADGKLDAAERQKLLAVLQARRYAAEALGLEVGGSFTTLSYLTPGTRIHVLSAAPMDSLEPHSWWFPVVGRLPYKGFFDLAQAQAAKRELERKGFDTYLRTAAAFSTLGWFDDPLLRSALVQDEVSLVNMILHELCHNTFSLGADTSFDESWANFVGMVGAMQFFAERDGPQSDPAVAAARDWREELVMAAFVGRLRADLAMLYGSGLSRKEMLAKREEIFRGALRRARKLPLERHKGLFPQGVNNAIVLHYSLYLSGLEEFSRLYRERNLDLRRTIEVVKEAVDGSDDPFQAVRSIR